MRSPVVEDALVAVGRAEQQQQVRALGQVDPADPVAGAFVTRFQANTGVRRCGASPPPRPGSARDRAQSSVPAIAVARAAPSAPRPAAPSSSRGRRTAGCGSARRSRPSRATGRPRDRSREGAGEVVAGCSKLASTRLDAVPPVGRPGSRACSHLLRDGQVAEVEVDAARRPLLHLRHVLVRARPAGGRSPAPAARTRGRRRGRRGRLRCHPLDHLDRQPRISGSSAAIRRGVNAFLMKPRRRVWSGGWRAERPRGVRDPGLVEDALDLGRPRLDTATACSPTRTSPGP